MIFINQEIKLAKFSVGDVVRLNSGSPKLTVAEATDHSPDNAIKVVWITGDSYTGELQKPEFLTLNEDCFKKVEN